MIESFSEENEFALFIIPFPSTVLRKFISYTGEKNKILTNSFFVFTRGFWWNGNGRYARRNAGSWRYEGNARSRRNGDGCRCRNGSCCDDAYGTSTLSQVRNLHCASGLSRSRRSTVNQQNHFLHLSGGQECFVMWPENAQRTPNGYRCCSVEPKWVCQCADVWWVLR